ncbi:hypothetical protein AFEL58S_00154 [Afipia felis]
MQFRHSLLLISALVMLVVSSQRTLAHEGHDHDVAATSVTLPASPRAETSSETFELVAVARSGEIVIYLDGFQSNEPVLDANVEIETPQGSVHARPAGDDTYRFPAPWAANTGRYDLIATVTKGDNADILTFTIENSAVRAGESSRRIVRIGAGPRLEGSNVLAGFAGARRSSGCLPGRWVCRSFPCTSAPCRAGPDRHGRPADPCIQCICARRRGS